MTGDVTTQERLAELPRSWVAARAVDRMIGYRTSMPGVHRGLPSPTLTLVFPLSGEIPIQVPSGERLRTGDYAIPVGGLHTRPVYLPPPPCTAGGQPQRGIQVAVHPLAARALFGVPAGELAGLVLDLGDILGPDAREMSDTLHRDAGGAVATAVVTGWVERRIATSTVADPPPEIRRAWELIVGSGGRRRIADVAHEVGWSRRHLTARLRAETGFGAKDIARVTRFQRARSMVLASRQPLAEIAVTCGYSDQSHLATEWRAFAGCTIGQWMAEEMPWLSEAS